MSDLNYTDYPPLDVRSLLRPQRLFDAHRSSFLPNGPAASTRPFLLDTLNDALGLLDQAKGHEGLVQHYVVQDFIPSLGKTPREEPCLVAVAFDQFSHAAASEQMEGGPDFDAPSSPGPFRSAVRGVTIFTLRG